jgi:hypothetical protein
MAKQSATVYADTTEIPGIWSVSDREDPNAPPVQAGDKSDIPGLVIEASSEQEIIDELKDLGPDLINSNKHATTIDLSIRHLPVTIIFRDEHLAEIKRETITIDLANI